MQDPDNLSSGELPFTSKSKFEKRQYTRFANELFGLYGLDLLSQTTTKELEFTKDVLKFMKKRIEIEEQYTKSLNQLVHKTKNSTTYRYHLF